MGKKIKIFSSIFIVSAVVFILTLIFLRVAFPPEKIKTMIESFAETELNREISFDESSVSIIGVNLHNFALSEKGGFNNGTFVKSTRLSFKVRLLPLLKKEIFIYHVKAQGLFVDIIKKDGKYNIFSDGGNGVVDGDRKRSGNLNFIVSDININKSQIQYFDSDNHSTYIVSDLDCSLSNFQLHKQFEVKLKFKFLFRKEDKEINFPFAGSLLVNLKNMNLFQAYAELKAPGFHYNGTNFSLNVHASNFLNPEISFSAQADVLTNKTFKDFISSKTDYKFNKVNMDACFKIDFKEKVFVFDEINLASGKSTVKSVGRFKYEKDNKDFNFRQVLKLDIEEVLSGFEKSSEKVFFGGTFNAQAEFGKESVNVEAWSNDLAADFKKAGITIPMFAGKSAFAVNFLSGEINFSTLDFMLCNSTITSSGIYTFKKRNNYNFSGNASVDMQSASLLFSKYTKDLSPEGHCEVSFILNNAAMKGTAVVKDAKVKVLPVFDFNNLNGQIEFNSADNINISTMSGTLNGEQFALSSTYLKDLRNISVSVNVKAKKLYFPDFPVYSTGITTDSAKSSNDNKNDIPYIFNLKISAYADMLELEYIHSGAVNLNADLSGITHNYDHIKGSFSFGADKVIIDNLQGLINHNAFTKVAFYALGMTYKTSKEMGVKLFDEKETVEEKSVVSLNFNRADGKAEFIPGFINIEKLKMISDFSSINTAGNIDLQTRALNMRLTINPLLSKSLVIKLSGTLDEPKTSLDLVGSVFTVLDTLGQAGSTLYDSVKGKKRE